VIRGLSLRRYFTSRAREHQHDDKAGGDNTAFKFSVSAKSALADWVQS
jgi:hypothetical protein